MLKKFLVFFCLSSFFGFSCQRNELKSETKPTHAARLSKFYNSLLEDQEAIEKLNHCRSPIYIYTDFGGGIDPSSSLSDLQTSGEIASAAWKIVLQQTLYINDGAKPLSPYEAAIKLAATFPFDDTRVNDEKIAFQAIVIQL